MSTSKTRSAVVTGASSGIGLELAKLLAADNYTLVLVARSKKDLDAVARDLRKEYSVTIVTIPTDLSDPKSPLHIQQVLKRRKIRPDILINNAGYGLLGSFAESKLDSQLDLMHVNMDAVVSLTRLLLPDMLTRKHGRILNVASTAAFTAGPMMAAYYASKAFVLSFSDAIAAETHGSGVTVTALCPGPTRTGFEFRATAAGTRLFRNAMAADQVARVGYNGLMSGKLIVVPGFINKLTIGLLKIAPRRWAMAVIRRVHR